MNYTLLKKVQSIQLKVYLLDSWWEFVIAATAHIYNCTSVKCLKSKTPQKIFLGNKPKTLHFHIFGYKVYIFLSSKVHANKLTSYSKLIIFIGYENNSYCFVYYIQENIIFHFIHAIFDEKLFPKYTNFHVKEYKLYNKLLDKISPETESSVSDSSEKGRPAPIPISHTLISLIQSNPPTHSSLSSLSYKSTSLSPTSESKKLSQIRYSLVVILELNGVSEVQYKDVIMIDDGKYQ